MGISRLPSGRAPRLGPLPIPEAETVICRAFRQFQVHGGEGWIAPLAERSFGWPQHVQRHLAAALDVIRDAGVDAKRADFAKAVRIGDRLREEYYHDRIESMATYEDEPTLVAQVFSGTPRKWLPNRDIAAAAGLSDDPPRLLRLSPSGGPRRAAHPGGGTRRTAAALQGCHSLLWGLPEGRDAGCCPT